MAQWHENCFEFYVEYWGQNYKKFDSAVTHGAENLAWTIRILLECLQHILKMYAWSLSENQLLSNLNADLLHYAEAISFSENMTLLFGYIEFIMIIRTSVLAIEKLFKYFFCAHNRRIL